MECSICWDRIEPVWQSKFISVGCCSGGVLCLYCYKQCEKCPTCRRDFHKESRTREESFDIYYSRFIDRLRRALPDFYSDNNIDSDSNRHWNQFDQSHAISQMSQNQPVGRTQSPTSLINTDTHTSNDWIDIPNLPEIYQVPSLIVGRVTHSEIVPLNLVPNSDEGDSDEGDSDQPVGRTQSPTGYLSFDSNGNIIQRY